MSLFLLVLGAATTVAGFILAASGVILPEGAVGVEVVTPGAIAAVGGLTLVGMGLVVRQLQRIERVLAVRPASPAIPHEAPGFSTAKPPVTAGRLPLPPKLQASSNPPLLAAAIPTPTPTEGAAPEIPAAIPPASAPLDSAPIDEQADLSLMPHADEGIREVKGLAVARGGNGARPIRPAPRVVARGRQSAAPDLARGAVLNAFWPDKSRTGVGVMSAEVALSASPPSPVPPSEAPPAPRSVVATTLTVQPEAIAPVGPAPISILKSGVVEGMAYSLYSDGSIEAKLPQGTLRFGSIEALRNHIENNA